MASLGPHAWLFLSYVIEQHPGAMPCVRNVLLFNKYYCHCYGVSILGRTLCSMVYLILSNPPNNWQHYFPFYR